MENAWKIKDCLLYHIEIFFVFISFINFNLSKLILIYKLLFDFKEEKNLSKNYNKYSIWLLKFSYF